MLYRRSLAIQYGSTLNCSIAARSVSYAYGGGIVCDREVSNKIEEKKLNRSVDLWIPAKKSLDSCQKISQVFYLTNHNPICTITS